MRRRLWMVSVAAACAGAAACAVSSVATAASAPPCAPKVTTTGGKHTVVNCGPAVVTVHLAGKTYTFKNGFCIQNKAVGAMELAEGTLVQGAKGNGGKPFISLLVTKSGPLASVFQADWGGKQLFGDTLISHTGSFPSKGSFTSTAGIHFTGTWDCHGVVFLTG